MIKHIVLWTLKDEALGTTKAENARRLKREIFALTGVVPGLRHIEAGISVGDAEGSWDVGLYSEFDSLDALHAYQVHPRHEALKELIAELRVDRAVIDYEV